jgi:sulfhydrogenase subunit beta (sulfur reductase)
MTRHPGRYRAVPREDGALFGYAVGARSWRAEVNEPRTVLVRIRRREDDPFAVEAADPADGVVPTAWIGVRGCDLAALAISDRVFLDGEHPDPHYRARREAPFIVAVDCGEPGGTCFCTSMGTGPAAEGDARPATHRAVRREPPRVPVPGRDRGGAGGARPASLPAGGRGRSVGGGGRGLPRLRTGWVARWRPTACASGCKPAWRIRTGTTWLRAALSCTSCTLVCPTCFCSTVEDVSDLTGTEATRTRVWDSCFTLDHSYLHGGSVRATTAARYRQWLTHKLDTWWDQFGTAGCVGCGRCTTWCPVGIDITVEAAAIGRVRCRDRWRCTVSAASDVRTLLAAHPFHRRLQRGRARVPRPGCPGGGPGPVGAALPRRSTSDPCLPGRGRPDRPGVCTSRTGVPWSLPPWVRASCWAGRGCCRRTPGASTPGPAPPPAWWRSTPARCVRRARPTPALDRLVTHRMLETLAARLEATRHQLIDVYGRGVT